ncbi:restriction endonuclease subunit S [Pseudomonas sp. G(2018)]|uniref:restriction endonuclease subunit S n=1 Tax=Pseudomonas sp. G(2018) TaxID=2502242 RepID=UPI0010F79C90|nr:restriction endonuclease subunit S [Pseudomonas sp. G(2018)]
MSDKNNKALKPGWRRVKFGDVVRLSKARSQDPLTDGFERYVGLEHLKPGDLRILSWGNVADGVTFTSVFQPGQVLFGKRRAYQRKVAVADFAGVCSGDIYVLETQDAQVLLPELLPFICQTDDFFDHAVGTSAGSLSPRTNWTSLAGFEFYLPPAAEQRVLLERLVAKNAADHACQSALRSLTVARRAALMDAFRPGRGSQDEFPKHWCVKRVGEAGNVQLGQKRQPSVHDGANVRPYLRVANVFDGHIDYSDLMTMHFAERDLDKFELRTGDILLNEGQSRELVGRSAIFEGGPAGICFQMTLLRFRCHDDLNYRFAHAFFQHCLYTEQFAARCLKTTSIAHLSASGLASMQLPVPPMVEQVKLVEVLEQLDLAKAKLTERRNLLLQVISAGGEL